VLLFFLSASGLQPPLLAQIPAVLSPVIKPVVNRDYLPTILGMINDAKKSIDFIQLEFHYDPTVKKIQDALKAAVKRGVVVRGILEDDIYFNPKVMSFSIASGSNPFWIPPRKPPITRCS